MQKIRKLSHKKGGNTPAVALTAYADSETRQKALAAGFQEHISKPVNSDELVRAILKAKKTS
ncbi:response regulator [Bdellovibrionota bacterium FG-1]